jgi:uncharacterized membrane protein
MIKPLSTSLLWLAAVGCGVIAGLYFTFSTFVMTALDRTGYANAIVTMSSINAVILKSLFMPLFYLTTLASLVLAGLSFFQWRETGAMALLAGGIIYVVGMFGVTIFFNVPLNNALVATDPSSAEAANMWARYLKEWNLWNHVRTITSVIATILFIFALQERAAWHR